MCITLGITSYLKVSFYLSLRDNYGHKPIISNQISANNANIKRSVYRRPHLFYAIRRLPRMRIMNDSRTTKLVKQRV